MGNGRYIKIVTKIWVDEKIRDLNDQGQKLFIYILTSPHSNMAGYYRLPKPYIHYDLKWSSEQLSKPFNKLLNNKLIKYCEESSVVLIPRFLKYNSIQNQNQAKGAAKKTSELPKNSLVPYYKKICRTHFKQYYELLIKGLPKPLGNTETEAEVLTEEETETVKETEKIDHGEQEFEIKNFNQGLDDLLSPFSNYLHQSIEKDHLKIMNSYLNKGMDVMVLIEAMKRSEGKKVPFKYFIKILHTWEKENIKSLDDIKRLDVKFSQKKFSNTKKWKYN